jgi:predicted transcriptional regulator
VSDCPDILISLRPVYTRAILDGRKTVELRRRAVRAEIGARVWLYSKAPKARLEGSARIERIEEKAVRGLWLRYSRNVGISRAEFDAYFEGCNTGCAIVLTRVQAVHPAVDLDTIRKQIGNFHPPQFFKRLKAKEVEILLRSSGCGRTGLASAPRPVRPSKGA